MTEDQTAVTYRAENGYSPTVAADVFRLRSDELPFTRLA